MTYTNSSHHRHQLESFYDHPTNAQLATATSWEMAYRHRNIHAVRLVSNANGGIVIP